tara:strand:- start:2392 stop:3336 length:945 start_codon:yes stop_codon:yes gene_type:complete
MIFKKPLFWDYKKPNFLSNILLPLTIPVIINNIFRKKKIRIQNNKIKTICVGNIYLGGTGKTPTTITVYNILKKISKNISTAKKFYSEQKDEQIILQKKTDLIIANSRKEIINKAIKRNRKLVIFDDGLQDSEIDYDLKFVCFNSNNFIGNGRLIPSGPLREKIQSLEKYDGVFLKDIKNKHKYILGKIKTINSKIKYFYTEYKILNLNKINKKKKYLVFSGIGNPTDFRSILIKNKIKIGKEIIFPDHYDYKINDIKKIKNLAKTLNLNILTTEKDFVKLSHLDKKNIKYLALDLKIKNEKQFLNFIKSKLYE